MKKAIISLAIIFLLGSGALAEENKYRLGPGDILEISVWRDETLLRKVVVPPDGSISFPLIGDLNVTGMTVTDVRKAVARKLTDYIPNATVTVMLLEINSLKAYVIGKVNNPGVFNITMNTSVMQVLAMASGLNPYADAKDIHILRHKKNMAVKIPFNYKEVVKGKNLKQNIILQSGDVVVVP